MASHFDNLSQSFTQLSVTDPPSLSPAPLLAPPPPPPTTPINNEGTSSHTQGYPSLLSILTIEDMFAEGPHTICPNHMKIQDIFFQPSMVQGRTILSWTSFANIILVLEDINCPSCAQTTILKLTQHLPFFEDNNERLEDIAQRVGGVTILRKWYTLLFWSSTISENSFFIPGTMGIPNPPSIFDNSRFWDLIQDIDEEGDSSIIGEVQTEEGEVIYIKEDDIVRDRR